MARKLRTAGELFAYLIRRVPEEQGAALLRADESAKRVSRLIERGRSPRSDYEQVAREACAWAVDLVALVEEREATGWVSAFAAMLIDLAVATNAAAIFERNDVGLLIEAVVHRLQRIATITLADEEQQEIRQAMESAMQSKMHRGDARRALQTIGLGAAVNGRKP